MRGLYKSIRVMVSIVVLSVLSLDVNAVEVKQLEKDAAKSIRMSERSMYSGKMEDASTYLKDAEKAIAAIKAEDAANKAIRGLQSKYDRQKKTLDKRTKRPAASSNSVAIAKDDKAQGLPSGVTSRLRKIDAVLNSVEKGAHYRYPEAETFMEEIYSRYGDKVPPDSPEVELRKQNMAKAKASIEAAQLQKAQAEAAASEQAAASKALSDKWLMRIRPYVANNPGYAGYDKEKFLVAGATEDAQEMQRRQKNYDEASALYEAYSKEDFSAGKTDELKEAERQLTYALESFRESSKSMSQDVGKRIEAKIAHLEKTLQDKIAKDDGKSAPMPLQKDLIPDLKKEIANAKSMPQKADWDKRVATLEKENDKLIQLKVKRTFMLKEQYAGGDASEIKSIAKQALHKSYPDAEALRVNIISADWKEQSGWEYTDTTKTQRVWKTRREQTVQIAAEDDAGVQLHTIYVAKDKREDGTWSPLYGHVMYSDKMLKENVDR